MNNIGELLDNFKRVSLEPELRKYVLKNIPLSIETYSYFIVLNQPLTESLKIPRTFLSEHKEIFDKLYELRKTEEGNNIFIQRFELAALFKTISAFFEKLLEE